MEIGKNMTGRTRDDIMTESTSATLSSKQKVPIENADMDDRSRIDGAIYVLNLSGVNLNFASTSHNTDGKGEDVADVTNYILEGKQNLAHREWVRVDVQNRIWVTYRYQSPRETYVTNAPRIIVNDPNGQTLQFYKVGKNTLKYTLSRSEIQNPNDFVIFNEDVSFTLTVEVYTSDPDLVDPRCKFDSVWQADIKKGEQQGFTLRATYSFWISRYIQELEGEDSVDLLAAIKTRATGNYRAGSHAVYDGVGDVRSGSYVIAMAGNNESEHNFVVKAFATKSLQLVRPPQWQ